MAREAKKTEDFSKLKKVPGNVLAEGEVTGHFHSAIGEGVTVFEDESGTRILDAPEGATITHQEHNTFTLPPGQYERKLVQEKDPLEDQIRNVRD